MRLLGIGILALLLIGSLVVLGQSGAFDTAWGRMTGGDRQRVDDYQLAATRNFDISGSDVFVTPVDADAPLILSGLPAYAGANFRLPIDARPVSGRYQLSFSSRVAEGVEGALRVSVNGVRRTDLLLSEGVRKETVDIELTPSELSASELDIVLSLQGRGEIAECTPEDSIAAVVEIEPSSGLRMQLDGSVESTRDKLALWGGRVPIGWSGSGGGTAELRSIINAARLSAKGYSPLFLGNGLRGDELAALSREAAPRRASFIPGQYPISLVADAGNRGVRKFGRRASWRYNYAAQEMPGQALPSALDLRMIVGPQASELSRDVSVTLNDRLLYTRQIAGDAERLNQSIVIPANVQRSKNSLEITISASENGSQRCGEIEQSVAELLPETVLRSGGERASDSLSLLRQRLGNNASVTLSGGELTRADAEAAARLLATLNPGALEFTSSGARSAIRIASGDILAAGAQQASSGETWVVYASRDEGQDIVARPVREMGGLNAPAVALFVTVPAAAGAAQVGASAGGQAIAASR